MYGVLGRWRHKTDTAWCDSIFNGKFGGKISQNNLNTGPGEMAKPLGALHAFSEDLGSLPITHMAAHSHLELQFQELPLPILAFPCDKHTQGALPSRQDTHTRKIK